MKNEPSEPAFPETQTDFEGRLFSSGGLTKREYFAAMNMQGLIASPKANIMEPADAQMLAKIAIHMTDALIEELNKTPNP